MSRDLLRKTACVTAAVLSLAYVSCTRQSVESNPSAAGQTSTDAANSAIGTAGRVATGSDTSVERDSAAIAALEDMSTYLRGLKAIQVHVVTSRDEVLVDGQNVTFSGTVDMLAERPNHLRVEMATDKQHRMFFADGKTFSVWARRPNYYATIPSPATLKELADTLTDRYDLELPVADLFHWGEGDSTAAIAGASDLGPSQVDGTTCQHYAFRQEGADWQLWIQQGPHPLPRKLVITTTTDPARPRYTAVIDWNLAPSYNDAAFTFAPPKDARKIMLAEARTGNSK